MRPSLALALLLTAGIVRAQTYQVGPEVPAKAADAKVQSQAPAQPLGWGSNIENARLARAAQLALQRGDHAVAMEYAERAAKSAPNDPQLWFLLGYAARLSGRYGPSSDAYQHGLHLSPSSIDGMSGLAQTYELSGRTDEAERLLKQVVAADPRRRTDLAILGDLYMRTGNYTGALEWLGRAERIEPAAQSELLMAVAYEHLKQFDMASRYLEMAKNRAPNNPDVARSLAAFYRDTGEFGKAVEALMSIRNPRPDVIAELAFTYALDGKPEPSARLYAQAANLLPRDLGLQLSAAQAQVSVGAIPMAETFLQRASRIDPKYYRLHAIRGEIAQIEDKETDAAGEYRDAVAALPSAPVEGPLYGIQLHMTLQALYKSLDEVDLAQQQLEISQTKISALDERGSDRAAFLRLRALIKMNLGQMDTALADMAESLKIAPLDPNSLQLDGDLLIKVGRTAEAIAVFRKVLDLDPRSRFALTSLGYASRSAGNDKEAERYFTLLAQDYPNSYVPFLALGDLYTARGEYPKAETSYQRGFTLAPKNSLIVAGGINTSVEAHNLQAGGVWISRVNEKMATLPLVMREEERYFSFSGDALRSANIGRTVIKALPRDRDVAVYLGYDLLHLEEYAELKALTLKYEDVFPKEPDIPLLAGYAYKHDGDLEQAVAEFTKALDRDPEIVTAYTNRGFVHNDLHEPAKAALDFEQAIKREPKNAEAHMGLSFAELSLHHWQAAIHETELAEAIAGDSKQLHIIRASAYGNQGLLTKSAGEFRAALKFDPNDGSLYLGLGNIYFAQRRYPETVAQLEEAEKHLPKSPSVYALMARANASMHNREETLRDIDLAEGYAASAPLPVAEKGGVLRKDGIVEENPISETFIATGEALSTLGDEEAAMVRFGKALEATHNNRMSVRLAIARLMAQQSHAADAERQIALGQMEADAGDSAAPNGEQLIEAANVLQQLHEFQLSESYLERAKAAGAADTAVRIALANSYLALGETRRAAAELAAVKRTDDSELDYQYLLAEATLFQQERESTHALSAFAAAASDAGENQSAEQSLLDAGATEGYRVTPRVSVLSNLVVQPIFEDSTVYVLDSKLNSPGGAVPISRVADLPVPRSSMQTSLTNAFHLHEDGLPKNGGYFEIRNARGTISDPATSTVVHRNTTDYALNFGLEPSLHLGTNVISFDSGVQGTLRRDTLSAADLDQNLFRVFTYASTTSFFNAVSASGFVSGEFGTFTQRPLNSRALIGAINFRVGSPWTKAALITGWGRNDQKFNSTQLGDREFFSTSSYVGLSRRFSTKWSAEVILEDLRSWRIVPFSPLHSAISQAIRPAATVDFSPNRNFRVELTSSYENTRGFHIYDMLENGISFSYTKAFDRTFNDETGQMKLKYPIRISGGLRQETFPNFTAGPSQQFRPYVSITLF